GPQGAIGLTGPEGPTGPTGPQGEQGSAGPAAAAGLRVVDSLGQDVGAYIGDGSATRLFPSGAVSLLVNRFGFDKPTRADLYYETTDCSGAAYMTSNPTMILHAEIVRGIARWASDPPRPVTFRSYEVFLKDG